jgi:ADP-ribosyl-[dinitrogen reductase] hydrolase
MIGSIIGDVCGSLYEFDNILDPNFEPLFGPSSTYTDDTVLTIATARAILDKERYEIKYKEFGQKYSEGYGPGFQRWLYSSITAPYNSCGNGSAMRVSPVGYAFDDEETVLKEAQRSAEVTHNHPEGIKGAQATALAIFLARKGFTKDSIRKAIKARFDDYDLDRTCDEIRPLYSIQTPSCWVCQGTVPEALIAFFESTSYENAIRLVISLGGDSDTIACITGGIAQAFYKSIPKEIVERGLLTIPEDLMKTITEFNNKFKPEY